MFERTGSEPMTPICLTNDRILIGILVHVLVVILLVVKEFWGTGQNLEDVAEQIAPGNRRVL